MFGRSHSTCAALSPAPAREPDPAPEPETPPPTARLGAPLALAWIACLAIATAAGAATIEKRVNASSDDAEEYSTTSMYLNSSDLELTHDAYDQTIGIRWTGITIPQGAIITAAYIQFGSKETRNEVTSLQLRGQAADDAATFTTAHSSVTSRPRTTAMVPWAPVPWNTGEVGANQRTPDLSALIQEIVGRTGWASGHSLVIIVSGTGHRTAWAWDGNRSLAPLLHVEYVTSNVDLPPVAHLSVTQLTSPDLTVRADAAGSSDGDITPIASYAFDFGDGSAPATVSAPATQAQHTYAAAGPYTVTVIATDTGGLASAPAQTPVTVQPPAPDLAPVAGLTASQLPSPALTVSASGAGSTDGDATPIASFAFDFGDGSAAAVVNAPANVAQHTYAAAGTYTVALIATDTGGLTSAPATTQVKVNAPGASPVAVYCGYIDTHHTAVHPKPNPWRGSPSTVFVGQPDNQSGDPATGGWDCSAVRVDNLTGAALTGVTVTVDIGTKHYALWGSNDIPAGYHLVLAQTAFENFDGSDLNPAGCYGCNPNDCLTKVLSTIPVVHVTVNGVVTNFPDNGQILNTHGADAAGCPYNGLRNDESQDWIQIYPAPTGLQASRTDSLLDAAASPRSTLTAPYPNPTWGPVTLKFRIAQPGPVKLAVYDVNGRLARTSIDGVLDAGEYVDVVNMLGSAPGVYFTRLSAPGGTMRKGFALVR